MAGSRRAAATAVPLLLAASILAGSATAATPKPKSLAAYRACLKAHGVTFGAGGARPSAAGMRAAFKACAGQAPAGLGLNGGPRLTGAQRAAFTKYRTCLSRHGVAFEPGSPPNRSSVAFKAAEKACASLRPAFPRRSPSAP